MKPFAVLLAALVAMPATLSLAAEQAGHKAPQPAAAAPAAAKPDLNAGSNKYASVCAACHGADGNSGVPANPKLAQQHPEYLVKQLQEFKSGKRPNPIMQGFAAQLTEQDMKNIGAFLGSQRAKPGLAFWPPT